MNGIAGQAGGIVGVRVAAGNREYALRQQLAQAMINLPGLPLVPQAGGQFIQQSIATIGGLQQQSSTVGAALSLIKLGNDRLAKNSWEQQTLCCAIVRHYGSLFCYSKHCLVNMFVTEEAFFCLQIRELSGLCSCVFTAGVERPRAFAASATLRCCTSRKMKICRYF